MHLIPTLIPIKTGKKYIAVLNERTAHLFDVKINDRIKLLNGNKKITAMVEVTEEDTVRDNQIGLFFETHRELEIKEGDKVKVELDSKPDSVVYIKKKLNGQELNEEEINAIIEDVVAEDLSDIELTYFVAATYIHTLSDQETVYLTKAIVKNGQKLSFQADNIMDKHCIGGVPGNRTTMLIVPIITANGLKMPKTSSRAITSPAGTADTMEVLANVIVEADDLQEIVDKVGGFITWGGGVDLASADDKLIRTRYPLSLDPEGMLLASIMAKKFAAGSKKVLIDIPVGPQVKVLTMEDGDHLKQRFENIGKLLGLETKVILTNGDQPIGNGIGPSLEARDVMWVLENNEKAPKDLLDKATTMAGILLEMAGVAKKNHGKELAQETITSGKALEQMNKIIDAQGRNPEPLEIDDESKDIKAEKSGRIIGIDNKTIARISRLAGAPTDQGSGVYIHKKLGDSVSEGETLFTIYSKKEDRIEDIPKKLIDKAYEVS